jgi:serine/threonine protein kinase
MLARPEEKPGVPPFEDWVKWIVNIRYPFELLKSGMIFVDLPGVSEVDMGPVQKLLQEFIRTVRPTGLCFLYGNPSFANAEVSAYEMLETALENTKDARLEPEIFFVSTRLDFEQICHDEGVFDGVDYDPGFYESWIKKRWMMLKTNKRVGHTVKASSYETDINFAVANALDWSRRSEYECAEIESTFHELRRRLFTFSVALQRIRFQTIYQRILDASGLFFRIYNQHRSKEHERMEAQAIEAQEAVKSMKKELIKAANSVIDKLPALLASECKAQWDTLWAAADAVSAEYDGNSRSSCQREIIEKIRDSITVPLTEHVISNVTKKMEEVLLKAIQDVIRERVEKMEKNQVLSAAIRNACIVGDIHLVAAGVVGSILHRFAESVFSHGYWSYILAVLAAPAWLVVGAAALLASIIGRIRDHFRDVNEKFRKELLSRILDDTCTRLNLGHLKERTEQDIAKVIQDVSESIDLEVNTTKHTLKLLRDSSDTLVELRMSFARTECECWVELRRLEGALAPLEILASNANIDITSVPKFKSKTDRCRLVFGKWNDQLVLVKQMPENPSADQELGFLEDAHYSLQIQQFAKDQKMPPSVMPAVAIHREFPDLDQPTKAEYSLIYQLCEGDIETLLDTDKLNYQKSRIEPLHRIYFCLQAALGVAALHQCGLVHRNVHPSSIWYKREGHLYVAYLTDFASCTSTTNVSTLTGYDILEWAPPEIRSTLVDFQQRTRAATNLPAVPTAAPSQPLVNAAAASPALPTLAASGKPTATRAPRAPASRAPQARYTKASDIWMLCKTVEYLFKGPLESYRTLPDYKAVIGAGLNDDPEKRPSVEDIAHKLQEFLVERFTIVENPIPQESSLYKSIAYVDAKNKTVTPVVDTLPSSVSIADDMQLLNLNMAEPSAAPSALASPPPPSGRF